MQDADVKELLWVLHPATKMLLDMVNDQLEKHLPTFPFIRRTEGPSEGSSSTHEEVWVDGGENPAKWIHQAHHLTATIHGLSRILLVIGRLNAHSLVWASDWLEKAGDEDDDWDQFMNAFLEVHETRGTAWAALRRILTRPQQSPEEYAWEYMEHCEREFLTIPWATYDQGGIVLPKDLESEIIHDLMANMEPGHPVRDNEAIDTWKKFVDEVKRVSQPSKVRGDLTQEEYKLQRKGHQQSSGWGTERTTATPTTPRTTTRTPQRNKTVTLGDLVIDEGEYDRFAEAVGENEMTRVLCEDDGVEQLRRLFRRFSHLARYRSMEECAEAMRALEVQEAADGQDRRAGRGRLFLPNNLNNSRTNKRQELHVTRAVRQDISIDFVPEKRAISAANKDILHGIAKGQTQVQVLVA
ncbi:hypothetical protein BGW41_006156 [Actinomortierella wolfii]|nr:hypothetical protein BGW41_006156 [Actinomortierella wolfii]